MTGSRGTDRTGRGAGVRSTLLVHGVQSGPASWDDHGNVKDVHATILDLLGLDDERPRSLHAGRLRRLTDIGGRVLR